PHQEHYAFYSFSRLLWHIFPFTVYFFKTAHTQPLTEAEMTKTLFDVCRMTPPSQNLSHTHQNQTFPSKPTICALENVCFLIYLQFFSIALAHFSNHCLLFQNSSHTALNRR